jgi:hypothetical protein
LKKTGATWIATTDYRTYAMLRWHFNGHVPVIQINERGRFRDSAIPAWTGSGAIRALRRTRTGQHVAVLERDHGGAHPLERVERSWRGVVMDSYALEKLERWTPSWRRRRTRRSSRGAYWRPCSRRGCHGGTGSR